MGPRDCRHRSSCSPTRRGRARDDRADHVVVDLDGNLVPVFHGGKPGKVGRIGIEAEAAAALAMQEHWRLLYVALTRAEDLLFIGGALTGGTATSPAKLPGESWLRRRRESHRRA